MQAALSTNTETKRQLLRDAESSLRACLSMDSADPRSYVVLGKLLVQQKRYDEARKLYADGTTSTGNTSPYIWAAWGYLESLTGNVTRARKLFDAAVVVDETHAAAWHKWGMLEMRQGNYLRARDLWTTGINKCRRVSSRSKTYLYCSLAVMAAELGKLAEARAWFQEGTRLVDGRSSCALWHAWAMTEARLGDSSAVRYLFKRSLEANPRSRYAHLAWSMWERQQGNTRGCLQLLARGSSLNPADPALYQARGIVEKEAGRYDEARTAFKQGLKVDASHLHLWQAWGVMEYQLGQYDEARRLFQEGVWADPGSKDVVYIFQAWGVLESRAGNAALARELFKAALKVDPKNESTWSTWIKMEEDLGRLDAANELRIRRSEQQWEFVIPASFSTRPGKGPTPSSGGGVLQGLLDTLNSFFTARGQAEQQQGGRAAATAASSDTTTSAGQQEAMRSLLPADFRPDLSIEDVIPATCFQDTGAVAGSFEQQGSSSHDGLADVEQPSRLERVEALRQPDLSHAGDDDPRHSSSGQHSSSGRGQSPDSTVSRSRKLSPLDRRKGLQRPQRLSPGALRQ
eukprot:GHUV01009601.1.p1 GENE.GHUV01009601.1~~GHUV01009601.1.p1  ORF type:complete len:573 (+),score=203.07 GHUV01009601.1:762-2480(+)